MLSNIINKYYTSYKHIRSFLFPLNQMSDRVIWDLDGPKIGKNCGFRNFYFWPSKLNIICLPYMTVAYYTSK